MFKYYNFSSPPVNIALPGLLLSDLLPLLVPSVVLHQLEVLQGLPGVHVEPLHSLCKCRDDGFGLAVVSTTPHFDVHVEQTGVHGH